MKECDELLNLREVLKQLSDLSIHLQISFARCHNIQRTAASEEKLIEFEALTSRFARVVDILIHKVYRSIDTVEFISGGTLIDVMNRAEKRNLIDSVSEMRLFKDLRNDIAHEYIASRIQLLHEEVLQRSCKLLQLTSRVTEYCKQYATL